MNKFVELGVRAASIHIFVNKTTTVIVVHVRDVLLVESEESAFVIAVAWESDQRMIL